MKTAKLKIRKFTTRWGKKVEIEVKPKVFFQLPAKPFVTALVRTYYPKDYRRLHQPTEMECLEVLA